MTMFDPKHPRGVYPGATSLKPQYVLITENGKERTSNVTDARITKAVYEIETNEYVTLEKCMPVKLVREAEIFAISFYKDSHVAVYFRIGKNTLRMSHYGFTCDDAADMMCDFFRSVELPDMTDWICEELKPTPRKNESSLTVDGEDFKFFGSADVIAALENIIDGQSKWMYYDFTGENGGYMNIRRCGDNEKCPRYKVEFVQWTKPTPTGYHTIISEVAPLRCWLWDFVDNHKYPASTPEWESFDVTNHFQRLVFRFLDKEDKLNKNER